MKTRRSGCAAAAAALLFPALIFGQTIRVDPAKNCNYATEPIASELYEFEAEPKVEAFIDDILAAAGEAKNFRAIATNVETAAAVADGSEKYLFYSPSFFTELPDSLRTRALFVLAHEIGHLVAGHSLDEKCCRASEEAAADRFAGYALGKFTPELSRDDIFRAATVLAYPHSTKNPLASRLIFIQKGWDAAKASLAGKDNLAFFDDGTVNSNLAIPRFDWPPPPCAKQFELPAAKFAGCKKMGDADAIICRGLAEKGYSRRSYFQVPGGFALVTQLEQTAPDFTCRNDDARWLDYAVPETMSGMLDYFKSLFMPTEGRFRVFAFIVTEKSFTSDGKKVDSKGAQAWLARGLNGLPDSIAEQKWAPSKTKVTALIYEFWAPGVNKPCTVACKGSPTADTHLKKSGLFDAIRK